MLNVLLIRRLAVTGSLSLTEVSIQLQRLLDLHVDLKDAAMIHSALWELCSLESSRLQAEAAIKELYRNSSVPYYTKWASLLGMELAGTPKPAPPIPDEVMNHSVSLKQLKGEITAIQPLTT